MPIVTLLPSGRVIEIPSGTMLFDAACRAGLPVASSCSAEAVCGKCVMKIHSGPEKLNAPTEHETKLLARDKRDPRGPAATASRRCSRRRRRRCRGVRDADQGGPPSGLHMPHHFGADE